MKLKVQISPDSGGLPERSVSLTGAPESLQKAKMMLDDIVSRGCRSPPGQFHDNANVGQNRTRAGDHDHRRRGRPKFECGQASPDQWGSLQSAASLQMVIDILRECDQGGFGDQNEDIDVRVPRHSVCVVICRSVEMIQKIQNDAGGRIQFQQNDWTGPEKIHIMWPPDRCEHAARIVSDLLHSLRSGPPGSPGGPHMPPLRPRPRKRPKQLGASGRGRPSPSTLTSLVMGGGGENVKAISQQTAAFLEIIQQMPPNGYPNFKLFIIQVWPRQMEEQLVEEIEGFLCPVGPGSGAPSPTGPMRPFNPGPFNQGHLGLHRMPGAPSSPVPTPGLGQYLPPGATSCSSRPKQSSCGCRGPQCRVGRLYSHYYQQSRAGHCPRPPLQARPSAPAQAPPRPRPPLQSPRPRPPAPGAPSAPAHPLHVRPLGPRPPAPGAPLGPRPPAPGAPPRPPPTRSTCAPAAPAHPLQARPLGPRPPAPRAPPRPLPTRSR
ncbi:LOW QUALITY PROTEIN: Far upstream element-binding protein 2 [Plecturocebus cupreus]